MSTWVIPYIDQDLSFWQGIDRQYGKQIHSVYLPMPGRLVASGRAPQADHFLGAFLKEAPLKKTVLINPIVLDKPAEEMAGQLINALRQLRDDYGVEHVTTASLTLARLIRKAIPEMKIAASTLMGISTPAQVLMAQDWIDTLIPDTRLLRDLPGLERLRRVFKGEMRLIVNEACLPGCLQQGAAFLRDGLQRVPPAIAVPVDANRPPLAAPDGSLGAAAAFASVRWTV